MTFKEFDRYHMYNFRNDRLIAARYNGFDYISEATVGLYLEHKSSRKVAKMLGVSGAAILSEIDKLCNVGLCSYKRGRGGKYENS